MGNSTLCLISGVANWDICFLDRKRLEPKELLWQHHWGYHFVSFVMHIYGAKFQQHCFNISNITIWRHHWSYLHNRKTSVSLKRKKIYFCTLKGLSNEQKIVFIPCTLIGFTNIVTAAEKDPDQQIHIGLLSFRRLGQVSIRRYYLLERCFNFTVAMIMKQIQLHSPFPPSCNQCCL